MAVMTLNGNAKLMRLCARGNRGNLTDLRRRNSKSFGAKSREWTKLWLLDRVPK